MASGGASKSDAQSFLSKSAMAYFFSSTVITRVGSFPLGRVVQARVHAGVLDADRDVLVVGRVELVSGEEAHPSARLVVHVLVRHEAALVAVWFGVAAWM